MLCPCLCFIEDPVFILLTDTEQISILIFSYEMRSTDSMPDMQKMNKDEIEKIWRKMEGGKKRRRKRKKYSIASTATTSTHTASRTGEMKNTLFIQTGLFL